MEEQKNTEEQKPYTLSRDTYKRIKSFDRTQMQAFIDDLYSAFKQNHALENIDFEELRSQIGQIKGIGESRLNEIMDVIERFFGIEE